MRRFGSKTKKALVAGALVLAGAALGAVAPAAAGGTTSPATTAGSTAPMPPLPPVPPEQQGPLFGVVHGELQLTKVDGSTMSLVADRGMITAVGDSEITLVRLDGQTVTVAVDEGTWVREGPQLVSLDTLEVGDRALFFSERTEGGGLHAVLIACVMPPGFAPPGQSA